MSAPLESQPWWNDILGALATHPLRDLARRHRVSVAALQAALERTGNLPTAAPEEAQRTTRGGATARLEGVRSLLGRVSDGEVAERLGIARKTVVEFRKRNHIDAFVPPRSRVDSSASASGRGRPEAGAVRRASRLDAFANVIGRVPDRDVAGRAGMTPENVRMYRRRRGIAASWRVEAPAPEDVSAPRRRGRQPAPPGETRVERALAGVASIVGTLPDAEVAARAGVSRSAVSAFRRKHEIKAGGVRGGARPSRAAGAPGGAVGGGPGGACVFRVRAVRGGVESGFGLVAENPVEAVRRAWAALTERDPAWKLLSVELVGDLLPE